MSGFKWLFVIVILLFAFLVAPLSTLRAQVGKISGQVTNAETGEPVAGVNIIVQERWEGDEAVQMDYPQGAASDTDGRYFIINLHPGLYNLRCTAVGYANMVKTQVRVNINQTTTLDFQLQSEAVAGQEVVVTAFQSETIEPERTTTKQVYSMRDIESISGITDISGILNLQADVVDNHFRGGRVGETQYLISGASITNPLSNERTFEPITIGLEQVEVITSGFAAEFGNAQSGVVNMVPREGGDAWSTRIELSSSLPGYKTWGGNYYSPDNHNWWNMITSADSLRSPDPYNVDQELWEWNRGPELFSNAVTDTATLVEMTRLSALQSTDVMGVEYKNKLDKRVEFSIGGPLNKRMRVFMAGRLDWRQQEIDFNQPDLSNQIMSNVTYRPTENDKIWFTLNRNSFNNYNPRAHPSFAFNRTRSLSQDITNSTQYGVRAKHIFSPSTFLEGQFNVLDNKYEESPAKVVRGSYVTTDWPINRWEVPPDIKGPNTLAGPGTNGYRNTITYSTRGNITSQINNNNLIKAGVHLDRYSIDVDYQTNTSSPNSSSLQDFSGNPFEGAVYIQDKMEYSGIIANIGMRYDFYQFNTNFLSNIYSPARNPFYDASLPYYLRENPYDLDLASNESTEMVSSLSPRLGVSFPISVSTVAHFNYGRFLQRPQFDHVLYNDIDGNGDYYELGNPRLKPEKTISYDVGIMQQLTSHLVLDASAYFKDVKDLIERAFYYDYNERFYQTFHNRDYANIRGFHISLESKGTFLNSYIRYNYQVATGKASNAFDAPVTYYERPAAGQAGVDLPDPEDILLDYDRTHRLIFNLQAFTPSTMKPEIFGFRPLSNLSVSATYRYQSGRPFTYDTLGLGLRYNQRMLGENELEARIQKRLDLRGYRFTFYLEGFNLLNSKTYAYSPIFTDENLVERWFRDRDNVLVNNDDESSGSLWYYDYGRRISSRPRNFRAGIVFHF